MRCRKMPPGRGRYTSWDSGCFVATAVYGNPKAGQVERLRKYRDEVLVNTMTGRMFIWAYYVFFGRMAAFLIKRFCPFLVPLLRKILTSFVNFINKGIKAE